jgi:hypothetical protein
LNRELITMAELTAAAHKQGFDSLDEVERAVIDPSGAIFFSGRKPTSEMSRHGELLERLDRLTTQVAQLRS